MNGHNKIKYNGKKYLISMFFHSLEVLYNIERYWVASIEFYKLLIPNICASIVNTHCKCIVAKPTKLFTTLKLIK